MTRNSTSAGGTPEARSREGRRLLLQYTVAGSVDAVANRIKRCGGTLESEPTDMPWAVRVFRFRDPDGFRLVISS